MKKCFKILLVVAVSVLCLGVLTACGLFGGGSSNNSSSGNNNENGDGIAVQPTVTVTLDPNGGTGVNQLTLIGKAGDSMSLPTPEREGYTFDKWYYNYSQIIDTTVFPKKDITLTARYYATQDTERTIYFQSEQDKEYVLTPYLVAEGSYSFNAEDFLSPSYVTYSRFLQNKSDVDIKIGVTVELKSRATIEVKLTGSNLSEVVKSERIDSTSYSAFTISGIGKSNIVHYTPENNKGMIRLHLKSTLGSTNIYFRNATAYITYTEKAGMLV